MSLVLCNSAIDAAGTIGTLRARGVVFPCFPNLNRLECFAFILLLLPGLSITHNEIIGLRTLSVGLRVDPAHSGFEIPLFFLV